MQEWTIAEWMRRLGAAGAPGGGAAALLGAIAAAGTLGMLAGTETAGGKRIAAAGEALQVLLAEDAQALQRLLESEADSPERTTAARRAVEVPREAAVIELELLQQAVAIQEDLPPHLQGDAYIAAVLLRSGLEGAAVCGLMNVSLLPAAEAAAVRAWAREIVTTTRDWTEKSRETAFRGLDG